MDFYSMSAVDQVARNVLIGLVVVAVWFVLYCCVGWLWWTIFRRSDEFAVRKEAMHDDIKSFNHLAGKYAMLYKRQVQAALTRQHDCSLAVVKASYDNPVKYVMKYFHYDPDELLELYEQHMTRLESLAGLRVQLEDRWCQIHRCLPCPGFRWFLKKSMLRAFGVTDVLDSVRGSLPYAYFFFVYVSPAGRNRQVNKIELNPAVLGRQIQELQQMTEKKAHMKRERAKMTKELRELVLRRDDYTCQLCGASRYDEPNLLLEVDHIVPVSRGGKTVLDNLQTLCWRCNRTKSAK